MAATAGVSPSHLLLEVEVEEMHGCMYSICSVIVPGCGWRRGWWEDAVYYSCIHTVAMGFDTCIYHDIFSHPDLCLPIDFA